MIIMRGLWISTWGSWHWTQRIIGIISTGSWLPHLFKIMSSWVRLVRSIVCKMWDFITIFGYLLTLACYNSFAQSSLSSCFSNFFYWEMDSSYWSNFLYKSEAYNSSALYLAFSWASCSLRSAFSFYKKPMFLSFARLFSSVFRICSFNMRFSLSKFYFLVWRWDIYYLISYYSCCYRLGF